MYALVNAHAPQMALDQLRLHATLLPFMSKDIVEPALSCHADLFMTIVDDRSYAAANMPLCERSQEALRARKCLFTSTRVDLRLASHGAFNIAVGKNIAIGNSNFIDCEVAQALKCRKFIDVRQGMCRCGALILNNDSVITSDGGIAKALRKAGISYLYVLPTDIVLDGYHNGCFGGCCGIDRDRIYIVGSLKQHQQGKEIRQFIEAANMQVVELGDSKLTDVGSIFFFC